MEAVGIRFPGSFCDQRFDVKLRLDKEVAPYASSDMRPYRLQRGSAHTSCLRGFCVSDLLERELEPLPVVNGALTLELRPFEIVTIRLDP